MRASTLALTDRSGVELIPLTVRQSSAGCCGSSTGTVAAVQLVGYRPARTVAAVDCCEPDCCEPGCCEPGCCDCASDLL
jgi:hypothetical protein